MSVDLEALKAELEAADFSAQIRKTEVSRYPYLEVGLYSRDQPSQHIVVDHIGEIEMYVPVKARSWDALDIIRRHVAPPAPAVLTAEEQAKTLREASQSVGLSNFQPWDEIGEHRQLRWLGISSWLTEHGYVLVRTKAVADGA